MGASSRSIVPTRSRMSLDEILPDFTWTMTLLGFPLGSSKKLMTPSMPLSEPFLPFLLPVLAPDGRALMRERAHHSNWKRSDWASWCAAEME